MLDTNMNKFKKIEVITVAKVGSSDFLHSMKNKYKVVHRHSLLRLKMVLEDTNNLIIVGIRNPLDRNISYLFQGYNNYLHNDILTKKNNYKGEIAFICDENEFAKIGDEELIEKFFAANYHFTFNDWFDEFFEITKIDKLSFDKKKGLQFYDMPNNNCIMMYTLEKLDSNKEEICNFLGIDRLLHTNNHNDRHYKDKYLSVKKKIKFPKNYKDKLLHTNIMNFFYSDDDINEFYNKYPTLETIVNKGATSSDKENATNIGEKKLLNTEDKNSTNTNKKNTTNADKKNSIIANNKKVS
ncbi:hypothetical protein QJ856_gp0781 [Tupanvirus deep ocean]|uniref:Uncharacterized protein n=2 Tax=Tupanvirus TaxID=2094720 RepID=A0AC62A8I4_9VIRU|nr:hypothetical protein QJ856_gp0781 [Tupanvirus deep ocean]QKU33972.1 hypothetical protein [Tupanvirus deep ocean]